MTRASMLLRRAASESALQPPPATWRERYGVALVAPGAALAATLLLNGRGDEPFMVFFAVAVMVSAWYGGWQAGVLATVAGVLANAFVVLPPGTAVAGKQSALRLGLF